jgi:hypothetical protein
MRILVFLHGTTIMHAAGAGLPREESVRQVRERHPSVREYAAYVPVGNAVAKLRRWQAQDAEIAYLSSHRKLEDVAKDAAVLRRHGFPSGEVFSRLPDEDYGAAAERARPDVLIEDDCESIGGTVEMTYPRLHPELRQHVTSIVVREFEGIDRLPDDVAALMGYGEPN